MKRLFLGLMILASMQSVGSAATGLDPYKYFFNETFGDLSEELQLARDEGKKGVFIFFEMDECQFCHYMKQNILNQPEVQAYYRERFINIPIDIEGDIEMTTFDGQVMKMKDYAVQIQRVRATPALIFFDLNGQKVFRNDGMATTPEEFMLMADYVANEIYKQDIPFRNYKEERMKADR